MWKPALNPGQIYSNVKTAIPLNYNRYGIQSPPLMTPFQNYMFAVPTKVNHASYQPVKEIEDKRKPGNLHHITIINAIIPKPYMPTKPTLSHPTAAFQNYRINNNKQLYNQYLNNFGRQNIDNYNNQLQQNQNLPMGYPSLLASQLNKPTIEYLNIKNNNNGNNNIENDDKEVNKPISQCGRKSQDEINNSGSNILYYYCNNRITNYRNPTQQQQELVSIQSTTTFPPTPSTTITNSTSTTTASTFITTIKSSHNNFTILTTEKPIFLPTPNTPIKNNFVPITSATIPKNSITDPQNHEELKPQRQKYRQKKYDHQRQTILRYEDVKRPQHQYTTAATYDNMKFHSFFTLEDAVTRAPEMQVFNDPYQAYRHARQQQINHQRLVATTTTDSGITTTTPKPKYQSFFDDLYDEDYPEVYRQTKKPQHINRERNLFKTTKIPDVTTATSKPQFKSFFDDLNYDDYVIRDAHSYDYSLYNKPKTSAYHEIEFENQISRHNQITHQTLRATEPSEISSVSEYPVGRPTIKEHHFGLFKSISPTTYTLPAITTYKPKKEFSSTTHNIPASASNKTKLVTSTSETTFGNQELITETETNNLESLRDIRTTTSIPIVTTTEKKATRLAFKSPLSLRSSAMFKYPNQRLLQKTFKNVSSSTTTKATNTLKKAPKYHRQYKAKKLKQFKHLYTTSTTTTTTTSTTTTDIPTTIESQTKRMLQRLTPATSTTEEPTTKKATFSRLLSTMEAPKQRQLQNFTTEATKRRRVKPRTLTVSTTTAVSESSIRPSSGRRGSKRSNIAKSEKDATEIRTSKARNKSRRRLVTSSTTAKPLNSRTSSGSTSTSASTTISTPATSSTTTTMKSIMRITNSKSRSKSHNDIRSSVKMSNDINEERYTDRKTSSKTTTTTMANIPPLPIEIYFKKSHSSKI